jgi:uncharacterized protein (TIGR00730 family)
LKISNLCIYCGSNLGTRPAYAARAREFARLLVRHGIGLVYGGARVGLMGALADAAIEAGGKVVGIIPRALAGAEIAHDGLSELVVTESMHARKRVMAERSDAFVALPGGIGTLEELFEIWTWTQLGFQQKPCGVLNVEGYYDGLVRFVDHAVAEGYLKGVHRDILSIESDPEALLSRLQAFQPTTDDKRLPTGAT